MTMGRTVLAGLAAGVVEAAVAVTPSETIKWVCGVWRSQWAMSLTIELN